MSPCQQKSPFKMFFKSLKGLLCLKLRIAGESQALLTIGQFCDPLKCLH
ncbi:hypothetical protein C789_3927 [Microcystis aeruginosa FACHB-905 = DIANCHI905]|nr:hypothetical protein C789_3927 [Microcystis aeruginosa FACHB-905 = DIANCHI905]